MEGNFAQIDRSRERGVSRAVPRSTTTTISLQLVGGGLVEMSVKAADLEKVAELLRRERGVIGRIVSLNGDDAITGRVLVPAYRVALVVQS